MIALASAPALAASPEADAERTLRGCLTAGSSGAPRTSLEHAIIAIRALCGPQIGDLREIRVRRATAELEGQAAEDAEKRTIRQLNDEIAYAVANLTGLHP